MNAENMVMEAVNELAGERSSSVLGDLSRRSRAWMVLGQSGRKFAVKITDAAPGDRLAERAVLQRLSRLRLAKAHYGFANCPLGILSVTEYLDGDILADLTPTEGSEFLKSSVRDLVEMIGAVAQVQVTDEVGFGRLGSPKRSRTLSGAIRSNVRRHATSAPHAVHQWGSRVVGMTTHLEKTVEGLYHAGGQLTMTDCNLSNFLRVDGRLILTNAPVFWVSVPEHTLGALAFYMGGSTLPITSSVAEASLIGLFGMNQALLVATFLERERGVTNAHGVEVWGTGVSLEVAFERCEEMAMACR